LKEKIEEVIFALEDWGFIKTEEIKEDGEVVDKKLMGDKNRKENFTTLFRPPRAQICSLKI